ncbi:dienelactone hydrolase family protein, partial [Paenibacillus sp. EKM208P]
IEDLVFRTKELSEFVDSAAEQYDFDRNNVVALGYSNGANIAASMLFHDAKALRGAILHHAMVPLRGLNLPDLNGIPVFLSSGENDPIVPVTESRELQALLAEAAGRWFGEHFNPIGEQV